MPAEPVSEEQPHPFWLSPRPFLEPRYPDRDWTDDTDGA